MRHRLGIAAGASALVAASLAGAATADRQRPNPNVAGVQTALAVKGLYHGPIDGIQGPQTRAAVKTLQERSGLASTSLLDARTFSALGKLGRPRYGTRVLRLGMVGLDVAGLQFELRYHGFPTAERGTFGPRTLAALKGFQGFAGLRPDGSAGRGTFTALEAPPPAIPKLRSPLSVVERTRPVGNAVELACPYATAVAASLAGTVVLAANRDHGYGYTVVTRDAHGLEILYAHLARIDVHVGQRVIPGALIGLAGWTGKKRPITTLRVELHLRGAQINAASALR
jgi:peptidoglycan hydrolase-like protein with peptidoglycan-binding domain